MSTLEDEVRRVLADPRRDPPGWPDPTGRVRAGMRRRHRRRVAAAAGSVTLAILLATAGVIAWVRPMAGPAPAGPSPTPTSDVIAWREFTAVSYPDPQVSPRPVATPCRGVDVVLDQVRSGGGAMGTSFLQVLVHNGGASRCTLSGSPALLHRDGANRLVAGQTHETQPHGAADGPATMDPGELAQLTIETYGGCLDGRPQIPYPGAALRLADGTLLPLSLDRPLDATCGVGLTRWYRPLSQFAPSYPWLALRVSLELPSEVHIGQTLDYVVTLTNPGTQDVALQPCPNYLAFVEGVKSAAVYQLNCAVPAVPAGGQVRFAMRLPIPSFAPAGPATVSWTLDKGAAEADAQRASGTVLLV